MAHMHIYVCDRCKCSVKGECNGSIPQYWQRVTFSNNKQFDICGACFPLLEKLITSKEIELLDTLHYERTAKP